MFVRALTLRAKLFVALALVASLPGFSNRVAASDISAFADLERIQSAFVALGEQHGGCVVAIRSLRRLSKALIFQNLGSVKRGTTSRAAHCTSALIQHRPIIVG